MVRLQPGLMHQIQPRRLLGGADYTGAVRLAQKTGRFAKEPCLQLQVLRELHLAEKRQSVHFESWKGHDGIGVNEEADHWAGMHQRRGPDRWQGRAFDVRPDQIMGALEDLPPLPVRSSIRDSSDSESEEESDDDLPTEEGDEEDPGDDLYRHKPRRRRGIQTFLYQLMRASQYLKAGLLKHPHRLWMIRVKRWEEFASFSELRWSVARLADLGLPPRVRWSLVHLIAYETATQCRVNKRMGQGESEAVCFWCGRHRDRLEHVLRCPVVWGTLDRLVNRGWAWREWDTRKRMREFFCLGKAEDAIWMARVVYALNQTYLWAKGEGYSGDPRRYLRRGFATALFG